MVARLDSQSSQGPQPEDQLKAKIAQFSPQSPQFENFKARIIARIPPNAAPDEFGSLVRDILNDDLEMLVCATLPPQAARNLIAAVRNKILTEEDAAKVYHTAELVRKALELEVSKFINFVAPNHEWAMQTGPVFSTVEEQVRAEASFTPQEQYANFEKLELALRKFIQDEGLSLAAQDFGHKYEWGQVLNNGGFILTFGALGRILIGTPWGEKDVIQCYGRLTPTHLQKIHDLLGLKLVSSDAEPLKSALSAIITDSEAYAITRIPGVEGELPITRYLEDHEKRSKTAAITEWLELRGGLELEPGQDTLKLIEIFKQQKSSLAVEAAEVTVLKIAKLEKEKAALCLLPLLEASAWPIQETIINSIVEYEASGETQLALLDYPKPLVSFLEYAIEYHLHQPGSASRKLMDALRLIEPIEPQKMIPLLETCIERSRDPQVECALLGKYAATSEHARTILNRVLAESDYSDNAKYYAGAALRNIS